METSSFITAPYSHLLDGPTFSFLLGSFFGETLSVAPLRHYSVLLSQIGQLPLIKLANLPSSAILLIGIRLAAKGGKLI
jgi:hypothetical protein